MLWPIVISVVVVVCRAVDRIEFRTEGHRFVAGLGRLLLQLCDRLAEQLEFARFGVVGRRNGRRAVRILSRLGRGRLFGVADRN